MFRRKKSCFYLLIGVILLLIIGYIFTFNYIKLQPKLELNSNGTKVILFWTDFYDYTNWGTGKETHTEIDLKNLSCPETNCIITNDREFLKYADLVLFHVSGAGRPKIPKVRYTNQSYVMFTIESPIHVGSIYKNYPDMFDLTMTYRLDSDIQMRYGIVVDKSTDEIIAPNVEPKWREVDEDVTFDDDIMKMIRNKNTTAAWFVSNCNPPSKRLLLARNLRSNGIDMDIYGKCGNKTCPFGSANCDRLLNSTYKFYYAFENSLYADYVTEKVFNNMRNFVVPVVYNGADMNRFLPPKSYINAQDFKKVAELASHLELISKNETEYMKFFWWKKYYEVKSQDYVPMCDLCAKAQHLNESNHEKYEDVFEWFGRGQKRKSSFYL